MEMDMNRHAVAGEHAAHVTESGLVVPVVTRAGREPGDTGQSEGATRVSGVSPQHTPATRIWFGKVHNLAGYRSVPHHHGEAETGGYVLSGRARIYFGAEVRGLHRHVRGRLGVRAAVHAARGVQPRPQQPADLDDHPDP